MNWNTILTAADLDAFHRNGHDLAFASRERAFYQSRTAAQLASLAAQAWNANERTAYVLARSYAALAA